MVVEKSLHQERSKQLETNTCQSLYSPTPYNTNPCFNSCRPSSWRWDARDSGVVEPVHNSRGMRHDSPLGRVDLFPSLHRADQ